jgi:hypothetical protein
MTTQNAPRHDALEVRLAEETAGVTVSLYEKRDVSVTSVVWLAIATAVCLIVVLGVAWEVLKYFRQTLQVQDSHLSPLNQEDDLATKPRLQETPLRDYQHFAAQQEAILNQYSMQDRKLQTVRIPISRSIDLIAERGNAGTEPQPKPKSKTEAK